MLVHIFYFIGFLFIPFSILRLLKSQEIIKVSDWIHKFKKVTGKTPEIKDFSDSKEWKFIAGIGLISVLESFWTIIGLLEQNWPIFLFLLLFGILTNLVNKQPFMIIKRIVLTTFFFIKTIFLILLVFNHFHGENPYLLTLFGF